MKTISTKSILISFVYVVAMFYLLFAFCLWDWNPANWFVAWRILLISISYFGINLAVFLSIRYPDIYSHTPAKRYKTALTGKVGRPKSDPTVEKLPDTMAEAFDMLKQTNPDDLPPIPATPPARPKKKRRKKNKYYWKANALGNVSEKLLNKIPTRYYYLKYPDYIYQKKA